MSLDMFEFKHLFTGSDSILGGKGHGALLLRKDHKIPRKRERKNKYEFNV